MNNFAILMFLAGVLVSLGVAIGYYRNIIVAGKYAYAYARIRAMRGRKIKKNRFLDLLKSGSVEDIVANLSDTDYGPLLMDASSSFEGDQLTTSLDSSLDQHMFTIADKIYTLAPYEDRKALSVVKMNWDIENLKKIVNSFYGKEETKQEKIEFGQTGNISSETLKKLSESTSLGDFVNRVPVDFQTRLSEHLEEISSAKTPFLAHTLLDQAFYQKAMKNINQPKAKSFFGLMADITNVQIALRCCALKLDLKESYFVSFGLEIRQHLRSLLSKQNDVESVVNTLKNTSYGSLLAEVLPDYQNDHSMHHFETSLENYKIKKANETFMGNPFGQHVILAYLVEMEAEIRNLRVILLSKKEEIPSDITKKLLVGI